MYVTLIYFEYFYLIGTSRELLQLEDQQHQLYQLQYQQLQQTQL